VNGIVILDTSVAIMLRDGDERVMSQIEAIENTIRLSIITKVELEGGVISGSPLAAVRRARLDYIYGNYESLQFDDECAAAYGRIISAAGYSRRKILDRMIAAQALVHQATLATKNPQDFADVPGLTIAAW
jgi:tRNA(fMet)-specific endonuclease VapC